MKIRRWIFLFLLSIGGMWLFWRTAVTAISQVHAQTNRRDISSSVSAHGFDNTVRVDGVKYAFTMAGIQLAASSLGSHGGTVILPCGSYQGSSTIATTVPTVFQGASNGCVNIQLTKTGRLLHAIICKASCTIKDLQISTQTAPTSDLGMFAVRLDTPNNGDLSGVTCDFERVIVSGYNGGLYCDGRGSALTSTEVNQGIMRDNIISIAGCKAGQVCEPISLNGVRQALIQGNILNNNSIGDHGVYAIQDLSLTVENNVMENTAGAGSQAVKVQNDNGVQEYYKWQVSGNTFVNVAMVALFNPISTDEVDNIIFSNNVAKTITDTTPGNWAVQIGGSGTAIIDNVTISGNKLENIQRGGYQFALASGARIKQITFSGANLVRNFSQFSSGTDMAIGSTSTGTIQNITIDQFRADGNSTGKAAYGFGASAQRINTFDLTELNMTGTDTPAVATLLATVIADQGVVCSNSELSLSAGWGSRASVGAVSGTGQTCEWTITSRGTGQAANPTITDTLTNALPNALTVCTMDMKGGTGTFTSIDQTTLSATAPRFTFNGTPVAGHTYRVARRCGP